jgi:hypothetical protein
VPTFEDLRRYLLRDGWTEEPNLARGRARTGDHRRYRRELADGTVLRTKLPHRLRDEIGRDLFQHILRDQLRVDEARFWAVVRGTSGADEGPAPDAPTIPGWLIERLIRTVGLAEEEVRGMTGDQALAAWEAHRARAR